MGINIARTIVALAAAYGVANAADCKCTPGDKCWPSAQQWNTLNTTVSGQLIATEPVAISCYPGSAKNVAECGLVDTQWANASFQSDNPVGLSYPLNITCPPVNLTAGEKPGSCSIGTNPRFAVNATTPEDVAATIKFAKQHNVRLVIKTTGHDILGRSDGYGSLEVWLRHLRTGITYQEHFKPSPQCAKTKWTGSAFTIGGGYTWKDVYPMATAKNRVVVGGGTPTVGCIGGWMQGGGHGPASREFGMGADQVLEAEVVLANGTMVTANPCQHSDIFFAIRGGGPGTYGVVVSTTIKAWPMVNATVQHLAIAPLTDNMTTFLDAVAIMFNAYPDLNDAGYAGYGTWSIANGSPLFGNFTAGYVSGTYMFNKTQADAENAFAPVLKKLVPYNMTSLFISVSYLTYPDYWSFYRNESGVEPFVGVSSALGSRLFSRASVQNTTSLRAMIGTIAGSPLEFTSNNFEIVSGGQVFKDASDPYSGLNPAWRRSYFNNIIARGWAPGSNATVIQAVFEDITDKKVVAMEDQAPHTGVYMNEGDRLDPDYELNFYGEHYPRLMNIKKKVDPTGLFYCPTCVGSNAWVEDDIGRLCKAT